MNIKDLLQTSQQSKIGGVRLMGFKTMGDPFPIRSLTRSGTGGLHQQTIERKGRSASPVTDTDVLVYCDCQDFKYRWDYALYRAGASNGIACHRLPSRDTNPSSGVGVCKHLARVLLGLYGQYANKT